MQDYQAVMNAIGRSERPLVVIPEGGGADSHAAALGMTRILKKLEKPAHIVSSDGTPPEHFHFLGDAIHEIAPRLSNIRTFIMSVDVDTTPVEELSYDVVDGKLHIYLKPKSGTWTEQDVSISETAYRYDLIICIGAPNLEALSHIFEDHPDFFFRTPIINIDHSPHNEHFGHYNLVDVTASSCGEVCHDWVSDSAPELLDEEIATHFLAGMIAKTKSFRTKNVTPKTLSVASSLMASGARRDEIIQNLYRTRSVETLRLWGRALARLKSDEKSGLVWTLLSQQDFMHAGTDESAIRGVVEELISSSPHAKIAVIIYEDADNHTCALVHAERPHDAIVLAMPFKPAGTHEEASICFMDKSIVEAEKLIVTHLMGALETE